MSEEKKLYESRHVKFLENKVYKDYYGKDSSRGIEDLELESQKLLYNI